MNAKNIFFTVLALFLVLPAVFGHALAQTGGAVTRLPSPVRCANLDACLNSVLNILLVFAAPIYALMIIISGYYFIFSGQSPANRQKAINIFKYSTIGLLILISARAIAYLVQGLTGA